MSQPRQASLLLLLLAPLAGAICVVGGCGSRAQTPTRPRFTVSRETTYLTEPLREDGTVDYLAGTNERLRTAPEDNAAVLLIQAIGPRPTGEPWPESYLESLGMEAPPEQGEYLRPLLVFAAERGVEDTLLESLEEQYTSARSRAWTRSEYPIVAEWLDAHETPLRLVVAASQRPRHFAPLAPAAGETSPALTHLVLPAQRHYGEIARMLGARARLRAGEGDHVGAWSDALALQRLGRIVGRGATLIEATLGFSIEFGGLFAGVDLLRAARPTADQSRTIVSQLDALPSRATVAESIDLGERFTFLDLTLQLAQGHLTLSDLELSNQEAVQQLDSLDLTTLDWDIPLRRGNQEHDRALAMLRLPTLGERQAAFRAYNAELQSIDASLQDPAALRRRLRGRRDPDTAHAEALSDLLVVSVIPAVDAAQADEDVAVQGEQLLRVALALAAYHFEHGEYPRLLEQLTPDFLERVPLDVFSDSLLKYHVQDDGYLLYSVGRNQRDDGGRIAYDEPAGDDQVVRMPAPSAVIEIAP